MPSIHYGSSAAESMAGVGDPGLQRHDTEFYDAAKKRRAEAIARGEDPYADFKKLVEQKGRRSLSERLWRKITGREKEKLTEDEPQLSEEQIKERNGNFDREIWNKKDGQASANQDDSNSKKVPIEEVDVKNGKNSGMGLFRKKTDDGVIR